MNWRPPERTVRYGREAKSLCMENKKWIRFVESFVLLPVLTMSSFPIGNTLGSISQTVMNIANTPSVVSLQKQNIEASDLLAVNDAVDQKLEARKVKADAIDSYFSSHDMPLKGTGMTMVLEAEKNDLDWRLLPAIAVRESTGGKFDCQNVWNNPFGWGSCKIGFNSVDETIATLAFYFCGNNPQTARYYNDKNTKQILRAYNPPSIVPRYAEQVISIMDSIGDADTIVIPLVAIANT